MYFLKLFTVSVFLIINSNNVFSAGSSSDSNKAKTKSLAYLSAEKLINKKVNKTTLDKIIFSQKFENQNLSQNKQRNKNKPKPIFLPEENYLNFKESGKIPDFLNTK